MDSDRETSPESVTHVDRTPGGARAAESLLSMSQADPKVLQSSSDPAVLSLLIRQEELKLQRGREQRAHELELARLNAEQERMRFEIETKRLTLESQSRTSSPGPNNMQILKGPKLPKYQEGGDIDVFLRTFERLASVHGWPESTWAVRLAPQLT